MRIAGWVSSRFVNTSRRRDMLGWSFHREVADIAGGV